jgi:hypothetical protein
MQIVAMPIMSSVTIIAEVPKHNAAQRPCEEADSKSGKRCECADKCTFAREKQLPEN